MQHLLLSCNACTGCSASNLIRCVTTSYIRSITAWKNIKRPVRKAATGLNTQQSGLFDAFSAVSSCCRKRRQAALMGRSISHNAMIASMSDLYSCTGCKSQIPLRYLVADSLMEFGLIRPAANRSVTRFEQVRAISTCRDSSNLLEPGRRPVRSQIPLCYLVADSVTEFGFNKLRLDWTSHRASCYGVKRGDYSC